MTVSRLSFSKAFVLIIAFQWFWSQTAFGQKNRKELLERQKTENQQKSEDYFNEGMKQDLLENFQKALPLFEKAKTLMPDVAAIYYKIAEVNSKIGNFTEAEPNAEKALKLDNKNVYFYRLLGDVYERNGKTKDAIKIYKKMAKQFANSDIAYFQLAALYINQKNYKEALKCYSRLEEIIGYSEELLKQKQQVYLISNNLEMAIKEARDAAARFPDEVDYQLNLARLLLSNNKIEDAEKTLNQILKTYPENPFANLMLSDIYSAGKKLKEAEDKLLIAFKSQELPIEQKLTILSRYLSPDARMTPEEKEFVYKFSNVIIQVHPNDSRSYDLMGDLQNFEGNKNEARRNYLRSVKINPNRMNVWENIVLIDIQLNEYDSLAKHTDLAAELFPNKDIFWYYSGLSNLIQKNHQKAVTSLEQAQRLSKGNAQMQADIYAQLGDAYNALKKFEKSDKSYEESLNLDPENAHVLNNYSYFLSLRNEKLNRANELTDKLVKKFPNDATYLDTRAWVLFKMENYAEAEKLLEKAVQTTESGTIFEHYGDVLFKLGQKEKALEWWKKAKLKGGEITDVLDRKIFEKKLFE